MREASTVIVGAGPAGLAVGACLRRSDSEFILLERDADVGSSWQRHYDRLHLHTDKKKSALPFRQYPESFPRYPSRDQFVDYLQGYARAFELRPQFRQDVTSVRRGAAGWETSTRTETFTSENVVLATGYNSAPDIPTWPGIEDYAGSILHSSEFVSGSAYAGQRVLVVGMGNSGGEIALDLCEHGVDVSASVRSAVNIIPRELFGIPILSLGRLTRKFPPRVSDLLTAPILRLKYGDIRKLGFRKHEFGPQEQIARLERIPLIDIGTVEQIRAGKIAVRPGVVRLDGKDVTFADGSSEPFDAIILATGFRPALDRYVQVDAATLDGRGAPNVRDLEIARGLFACGFHVSAAGMLQAIGAEATEIASRIGTKN